MPARTIILGDVHGMLHELNVLLDNLQPTDGDRIISTGDVVHKGPDSAGAVRRLRELGAELALGNHEEKQTRFRRALAGVQGDLSKIKMKNPEELAAIEAALTEEDIAYLESAKLFVPVPGGLVVHAGLLPTMEAIPTEDELAAMSKGDQKKMERVLRVRHVRGKPSITLTLEMVLEEDPMVEPTDTVSLDDWRGTTATVVQKKVIEAGSFISLGQEGPEDPFWAEVYDGRHGHVYFGHQPYVDDEAPKLYTHATGLDLGAVFGGHLAAVVLEEGQPVKSIVVKASGKFATSFWED